MAAINAQPLVFWKDLSPHPVPLEPATPYSPRILIVGGGVIGLTTAWTLLDKGYHVTVIAKEWASFGKAQRLTSQIAGALWEFPPAVCGQHTDAISLHHSKRWSMISYHIWDAIAAEPGADPERPERAVVALCRCGASSIKPLCDGTHKLIGFTTEKSGDVSGGRPPRT